MLNFLPKKFAVVDDTISKQADFFKDLNQDQLSGLIDYWVGVWLWLVGILTFLVILYSAFLYMTAAANEANAQKAKKFLIWGIVGAVVLVLSLSIVSFSASLIGQ